METGRHTDNGRSATASGLRVLNDNRWSHPCFGHSLFPENAVARIFKPSRSVTTSGTARTKGWRFVFDGRSAPFIEPLTGYTGSADALTQVELKFPTLESAIRYAERPGLSYVVQRRPSKAAAQAKQGKLTLQNVASCALAGAELALFVPGLAATTPLPVSSSTITGLRGDGYPNAAAAPVSCSQETAYDDATNREGENER